MPYEDTNIAQGDCSGNSCLSHTLALLKLESFEDIRTLICRIHHFFERKVEVLTRYNQEHNKWNYKKMAEEFLLYGKHTQVLS